NILNGANTLTPEVDQEGYYILTVTNPANGCTSEDVVYIGNNIVYPEAVILDPQQLNCVFTTVELDGSFSSDGNEFDYTWTTVGGSINSGGSSLTPEVDAPGTYTLVIENEDNFCTATASVVVTQDITAPVAVATTPGQITCQFPQLELSGAGSSEGPEFFYLWSTTNGNILSGELTLNPIVGQIGTYTIYVSNVDNGCETTASVTVTSSQTFPTSDPGNPQDLTCAVTQLNLDGSGSSQGPQYAYTWYTQTGNIVSGGNTLTPLVNAPGTYDLTVINLSTGCTTTSSVDVGLNTVFPTAATAPGGILSCTVSSLTLSGAGSSTGAGFSYAWSTVNGNILSGGNSLSPVVNATGDYTLVVSNTTNGCSTSSTTTVGADASLPVASAGAPQTLDCNVQQFNLNGNASSQGALFGYVWTGPGIVQGGSTLTPLINQPGLYELLVTNTSNGCTAISAVTIPQDIVLPVAEAGPAAELNCTFTSLGLDGNGSSTGSVFTYLWTTSNGNILNGATTLTPQIDAPGTYTLLVSNTQNGCSFTDAVIITEDVVLPQANAGNPGLITCTNATVTLNGSGSTGPIFTYTWTTPDGNLASGANTLSPVVDAPGTYTLLVSNSDNGCTSTASVDVAKDANVPTALAVVGGELNCVTNQLQIDATGSSQGSSFTYNWTTPNGNIVSGGNTLTPVVNQPGQYALEVFNTTNNCLATSTVTVNLNLVPPVADAGAPAVISCLVPVLTLNGGGSSQGAQYTYQWSSQNGNILSGGNTINPQIDESGFYTIVVTDQSNGCTAGAQVQIILDQNTPESNPGASPTLTCNVTSLLLNGLASSQGPPFTYLWTTSNGNIVSGETTLTPTIDQPGTYTLLVTNFQNGCTSIDDVLVNQNITPPVASAGNAPTLTCATTSLPLNGTGSSSGPGFSYLWTTTNGSITGGVNTTTPTVNDPGLYNLLVTNNQTGCTNTAQVDVFEDVVLPQASALVTGELTCSVTSLDLNGTGSSTGSTFGYLWTTSNGQISNGATSLAPSVTAPGTYQLLVTNAVNGCTQTATVPVTQNITAPQANAGANALLTCAVTSLNLTGSGSGGVNGVSYAWTGPGIVGGGNTTNPTIDLVGVYTLTVTDLYNGCTKTDAVQVAEDILDPIAAIVAPGELTCVVTSVNIDAGASSQGSQFQYTWNGPGIIDGAATLSPLVDQPGAYNLLITNILNGCTATASTQVSQTVAFPLAEAGNGFELTCSVDQGTLSASGSSSGPNFSYTWSTSNGNILGGANTAAPLVNEVGVYTLQVLNTATGCSSTDVTAVTLNTNLPTGIELLTELPGCGDQPGSVQFEEVTGGVGPYLFSIDDGETFLQASQFGGLSPGTYNLVVQDANGCEYADLLQFPVPVEPTVTLPPTIQLSFGASQTITATINIPMSEVDTIIWSPMEGLTLTSQTNVVLAQPFTNMQYTVTIINKDGCEDRAVVSVRVDDPNIWAPNVISSGNQDGLNDNFLIFAAPGVVKEIKSLQVYDRWGNQLFLNENFQPNEERLGWNGSFRGENMNPGVYVWWAEVELISGEKIILKGDVTIVD
ncbi:MAG: gliding motility-associated C-terminal domain-containing protein, partial [Saprospiraceae bacterium]|nr:gliding motility-associated C-terminal domain-containing protein [Saprospiraceae bacterium]